MKIFGLTQTVGLLLLAALLTGCAVDGSVFALETQQATAHATDIPPPHPRPDIAIAQPVLDDESTTPVIPRRFTRPTRSAAQPPTPEADCTPGPDAISYPAGDLSSRSVLEKLADLGPAPNFDTGEWVNAQPIQIADLRGKVVLVEIWSYG